MQTLKSKLAVFIVIVAIMCATPFQSALSGKRILGKPVGCPVCNTLDLLANLRIFSDGDSVKRSDAGYPIFPDLVYEYHLAEIDNLSPIDFDFNPEVKRYIEIYTLERREQVEQMLGLADFYFPLFDEMLDRYSLPLELRYLAVVESALNPLAISPTGAVGLWQFKINTSRMFNLEVNSYVDERMDPQKSTEAACVYLQYLYRTFRSWHLALAAYNVGSGVVRAAIQQSGGETNFWKLRPLLPEAAQNYVPAFIAAAYVFRNAQAHEIVKATPSLHLFETDTVVIREPIHLGVLAQAIGASQEHLQFLNPSYRQGYVPKPHLPATIRIPRSMVSVFVANERSIYEGTPRKITNESLNIMGVNGQKQKKSRITHVVRKGEFLHKIAIIYACSIDEILEWNPGMGPELSVGQVLEIWADPKLVNKLRPLGVQP